MGGEDLYDDDTKPRTLKDVSADLATAQQNLDDLTKIVAMLKETTPEARSRGRYLELRRRVRKYAYSANGDYRHYGRSNPLRTLEMTLRWRKEHPPETLPPTPPPPGLRYTWHTFPRIDGSTTAQPLVALLACRALGLGASWESRRIHDTRNAEGSHERILVPTVTEATPFMLNTDNISALPVPGLRVSCELSGTPQAYNTLVLGISSLIIVARPPSASELAFAKSKGVTLDVRPIGLDAFVFLLNGENPLNSLTRAQIQAIYRGDAIRWDEFGGKKENIIAFQREEHSGSQDTIQSLVMKDQEMIAPQEMYIGYGMGGPYVELDGTPNGIGYTFYYYHTKQSPDYARVAGLPGNKPMRKMCAIDGIMPSADTIRNRTYPYATEVYAVVRTDAKPDSAAVRLRDWLLTPEGQQLVAESGYVPLPAK
jgi:phosphate transport system substrate-binding protein